MIAESRTNPRWMVRLLISGLVMLGAIPLDVMLPSYPAMAMHFARPVSDVAWSISVFALGFAVAQLFVGPLSDHYGRKKILIAALLVAAFGSGGAIFATDFHVFLAWRIIQAAGCSTFVLAQAIVQDEFKGKEATRARIFITSANGVLIAISPVCGSVLQQFFGWRGSFELFVVISVGLVAVAGWKYAAPLPSRPASQAARFYAAEYVRMFSDSPFVIYWLVGSIAFSCHFAFIVSSPLIFLEVMKMSATAFSAVLLLYGLAYVVAGVFAGKIIARISEQHAIYVGYGVIAAAGLVMFVLQMAIGTSAAAILVPMVLCTLGTSLVRPCAASLAMARFSTSAGTASAAGSSIRMLVGGVVSGLTAALGHSVIANLIGLLVMSSITCWLLLRVLAQKRTEVTA